jgi:hypothetical protein
MFSLHLVDDATDDPIAGAKLTVKLPGSTERTCPTDAAGRIDLATIKGGTVDVSTAIDRATIARALVFVRLGALSSSQPTTAAADQDTAGWPVIQLVEHRVKSGETLDGIARRYNLSANALMQFNWQTNDPDEVDRRLLLEVGCQKRGADQHVVFDDADQPGIVYCPAALRLRGLALDTLHIVRVKRLVRKKVYQYSV